MLKQASLAVCLMALMITSCVAQLGPPDVVWEENGTAEPVRHTITGWETTILPGPTTAAVTYTFEIDMPCLTTRNVMNEFWWMDRATSFLFGMTQEGPHGNGIPDLPEGGDVVTWDIQEPAYTTDPNHPEYNDWILRGRVTISVNNIPLPRMNPIPWPLVPYDVVNN